MKESPFFSIVIPTRQRHETLPFSIKTILNQEFTDYEIIVSDNASSIETKRVIEVINNPKIKYVRTENLLSMADNWELAVSYASGKYLILFGDDDGMIDGSLEYLYNLIQKLNYSVIRWERVYYEWGNSTIKEFSNKLSIPFNRQSKIENGLNIINKVINFKMPYTSLPMLYNSVVERSLLIELKNISGRFFSSAIPDIYSGFAIAYLVKEYLSLGFPLSINGGSGKSNGAATMQKNNTILEEFNKTNNKSIVGYHPKIPNIRSMPAYISDPFLQFVDKVKPLSINYNIEKLFKRILNNAVIYDEDELNYFKNIINNTIQKNYNQNIQKKLNLIFKNTKFYYQKNEYKKYSIGIIHNDCVLDASNFGLHDVFEVSKFVKHFYVYSIDDVCNTIKKNKYQLFKERLLKALHTSGRIIRG